MKTIMYAPRRAKVGRKKKVALEDERNRKNASFYAKPAEAIGQATIADPVALGSVAEVSLASAPEEEPKPRKKFRVSLDRYGPTSEHEADTEEEAWEAFKRKHGILASDVEAEITELHDGEKAALQAATAMVEMVDADKG